MAKIFFSRNKEKMSNFAWHSRMSWKEKKALGQKGDETIKVTEGYRGLVDPDITLMMS